MRFATVKKGYDPKAVDQYIAVKSEEHKDQLETAKERNALLAQENEDLHRALEEMRRNEAKVTRLLMDIQSLLERTEHVAKQYAEQERERLLLFKDKWVEYATQYLHRNLSDFAEKMDDYAYQYAHRVQQNLSENLFLLSDPLWADYQAEQARTQGASDTPVHIEELLSRLQKKE